MRNDDPPRLLWPALFVLLIPATACMANPCSISPIDIWMGNVARIIAVVAFDFVFDAVVLLAGYLLLRRWSYILAGGFLNHILWVFAAGLAIDFVLYGLAGGPIVGSRRILKYAVAGFLALALANYIICTAKCRFPRLQGIAMAAFVGIVTNPVIFGWVLSLADSGPQPWLE